LIDTITYDGFGNVTNETNSAVGDRWKFTGREFDSETGLQFNRARYLDQKTGRWTSQDPIGLLGGDQNLYRYVRNRSTNILDKLGLAAGEVQFIPATVDELIQQLKARGNTEEIKQLETEFGFDISNEESYNKVKNQISLVNVRRGADN